MKRSIFAVLAVAGAASAASAAGIVVPFNVAGIQSFDALGDTSNTVVLFDAAAALGLPSGTSVTMNGIGWDVAVFADPNAGTFGGSWINEIRVAFRDSANANGFNLTPAAGSTPGPGSGASAVIKLDTVPLPEIVLADGILRLEFYEGFDDAADIADGQWVSGVLNLQFVPAPGAAALAGMGGLLVARRRRA